MHQPHQARRPQCRKTLHRTKTTFPAEGISGNVPNRENECQRRSTPLVKKKIPETKRKGGSQSRPHLVVKLTAS
jgi:hypothetical protein